MIQLLVDNPLLTLVIVAAIGYAVGQIKKSPEPASALQPCFLSVSSSAQLTRV